ncbi:MAG: DUF2605 domain-containing protein [Pleurocapsa sp.]
MSANQPTEKELLKTVLEPLLEDFQYWFDRTHSLLASERLSFLSELEQTQLLKKIERSQQEVNTAQILFKATEGEVGIDPKMLLPWHRLVAECWSIAQQWRELKNSPTQASSESEIL